MNSIEIFKNVPGKILIIRLSSIGDILLSTPFIRQLRAKFPKSQIGFIVKDIYADLLRYNPNIDEIFCLNSGEGIEGLSDLKLKIRKNSYQIVFDLHNNLRSNYLKRGINAGKICSIKKGKLKQTLLVRFKLNLYDHEIPIPFRYLSVAKNLGVTDDQKGLELYWPQRVINTWEKKCQQMNFNLDQKFICLAPGAGFFTKRWPEAKFNTLVNLIHQKQKIPVVVLGGDKDQEIGRRLGKQKNTIDFCGKLSLLETAYIISKGKIIVTNDSGLMHMATAVQTPVLAIFGSTVKELGFFPYRAEARIIENSGLSCRPCSHIGRHYCPKKHFKCMEEISPENVYAELEKFSLK